MEDNIEKKEGIENVKFALLTIIKICNTYKLTRRPIPSIILNLGKLIKVNYKAVGREIKDLSADERRELIDWLAFNGFNSIGIDSLIDNLGKRRKLKNIVEDLLK